MPDQEEAVTVIQADRHAAAANIKRRLVWMHGGEQPWMDAATTSMRMGEQDDHDEVLAFARHRTSSSNADRTLADFAAAATETRPATIRYYSDGRWAISSSDSATPDGFLDQLRRVNTERYHAWVGDGQDAGILFDAAELGGEVGELLNVVKKLEREERGWRGSRAAPEDFADECADVLICLDKLARRKGVDLAAATARKFNATSEKVGLPHRLSAAPTPGEAS